jgi:hypothetical protein
MRKKIILSSLIFVALLSFYGLYTVKTAESAGISKQSNVTLPKFNVKVVQYLNPNQPQQGAEVVYKQNGNELHSDITDGNGIVYWNAASGTYDVYVYYPPRPNDQQLGTLLGHYHSGDELVTIQLGPYY